MRWIDVFGPPGVGKSTLADDLWHPHAINWHGVNSFPKEWGPFLIAVESLLVKVNGHWSFDRCLGMTTRSLRKMAAVHALERDDIYSDDVYIQTGFAQRGLGFGWRVRDPEDVRAYYELMPASLGVVSLDADDATLIARNRARAARGEDRAFMVPLMRPAQAIALETLKARGLPLLELDTRRPVEDLRRDLLAFRDRCASRPEATVPSGTVGLDRQAAAVSSLA